MNFEKYIQTLLSKEIVPGISVLVARGQDVIYDHYFGHKVLLPDKKLLNNNCIYDVASLTKPLITTFLLIYLMEQEGLNLGDDIRKFYPSMEQGIQLKHLLTHTSGFPAWYPFYLFSEDYLSQLFRLPLVSKPGKKVEYSCVGYILLYYLIEKISGSSFQQLAQQIIISKLGLNHTYLVVPEEKKSGVAATEWGNGYEKKMAGQNFLAQSNAFQWREYLICGETHDANSYYQGGSAGNSGLFSTCKDLYRLSREFYPESAAILKAESLALFWRNFTPGRESHRTIGFKLNSSFITSGGRALSKEAIGHNGFTGTSIWLEPERGCQFIILTNRIHPRVSAINFNRIRRKLHHLLVKDLHLR